MNLLFPILLFFHVKSALGTFLNTGFAANAILKNSGFLLTDIGNNRETHGPQFRYIFLNGLNDLRNTGSLFQRRKTEFF